MKAKLKVREVQRDEFLSLVTHEIKNALTAITGFAYFAKKALRNHDDDLVLESLDFVSREAERVNRLAEDLLDVAQFSTGKFSVLMEPVDLNEIASEVAGRYSKTTSRRIEIQVAEKNPRVLGDSARLAQMLENLVSNATKYSPEETAVRVALTGNDSLLTLTVWNGGQIIPAEEMPRMFQRFSRGIKGSGKLVKGTGLGLFISKQIAELHGGSISVVSEEESGTTFTVELPRQPSLVSASA